MSANDLSPTQPENADADSAAIEAFVERWRPAQAAELANAQPFLIGLAALLGVPGPEPATKDPARDGYVFERPVGASTFTSAAASCWRPSRGVDADNAARDAGTGKSRSAGHGRRGTPPWGR